jgi:hypothetical protein
MPLLVQILVLYELHNKFPECSNVKKHPTMDKTKKGRGFGTDFFERLQEVIVENYSDKISYL